MQCRLTVVVQVQPRVVVIIDVAASWRTLFILSQPDEVASTLRRWRCSERHLHPKDYDPTEVRYRPHQIPPAHGTSGLRFLILGAAGTTRAL